MAKMTNDLPSKVKVAWADYRIEVWRSQEASGAGRYGETAHTIHTIRIDPGYGTRQAASTLLHEIMHAVARLWFHDKERDEENIVVAFQHGLCTVWRDNPDVLAWIGHHLVHGD